MTRSSKLLLSTTITYSFSPGKQYLLKGEEVKERGLVFKAVEDILRAVGTRSLAPDGSPQRESERDSLFLECTIHSVGKNGCADLLHSSRPIRKVDPSLSPQGLTH